MYLQRQISAVLGEGEKLSVADIAKFPYKLQDVLPKYVLSLGEGKVSSGYLSIAATGSDALQRPENYDTTRPLSVIIRTTQITKVVVVSPTHGTSTFLIKSTDSTAEGEHFGCLMFQSDVTSITLSVPATFSTSLIEYFMWEVPDLDLASSWQLGQTAIGYVEGNE